MASSGLFALHSALRIMRGETPPDPEMGWSALHQVAQDHESEASRVRLAAPQEAIARVLERTGMTSLFGVDATRASRGGRAPGSLTNDERSRAARSRAAGARAPGRPANPAHARPADRHRGRRLGDRQRLPARPHDRRRLLRRLPDPGSRPAAPPRRRDRRRLRQGRVGGAPDGIRPARDALGPRSIR